MQDFGNDGWSPSWWTSAGQWAVDVVDAQRPVSRILPSVTFHARFLEVLPRLVAPDA